MTRRLLLLLSAAAPPRRARADAAQQVVDLVASMAAGLAEGRAPVFLDPVDRSLPGYAELRRNVFAIVAQAEVSCSIVALENGGDEHARILRADWRMQLRLRSAGSPVERRRAAVTLRAERRGSSWKVTAIEPASFFAPPRRPVG